MRVLLTISYNNIMLNIIPTFYAGYTVSVHRMGMKIVLLILDPANIQGSHRPISFMRIKYRTRANDLSKKW